MSSKQPSADGTTASTSAAQRNDESAVLQGLEQRIRDLPNAEDAVSENFGDITTQSDLGDGEEEWERELRPDEVDAVRELVKKRQREKREAKEAPAKATEAANVPDESGVLQGLEQRIRDLPNARATVSSKADDRRTNSVQEATPMSSNDFSDDGSCSVSLPLTEYSFTDRYRYELCEEDHSAGSDSFEAPVKYELHDFDTRGLGEAIRLLFAYTNTPFEDVRITREQWPERKPTYKFGKVPVLKVDGQELAQSAVILRYLGEKFGLAGKDEWEKAKVNEVVDFHKDVYSDLAPYFHNLLGFRVGDKTALRKVVFLPNAERLFPQYVRLLKESGSGFFAPSGLTFVDFSVAVYFQYWTSEWELEFMKENYPEIVAFVERVYSQIQDHMKN
ncbi:putative glutathione S-transferase 5 [Ditylenchus destructor]|nr:putative glutathione S-transferase 5 [Ditylenchus destructor]